MLNYNETDFDVAIDELINHSKFNSRLAEASRKACTTQNEWAFNVEIQKSGIVSWHPARKWDNYSPLEDVRITDEFFYLRLNVNCSESIAEVFESQYFSFFGNNEYFEKLFGKVRPIEAKAVYSHSNTGAVLFYRPTLEETDSQYSDGQMGQQFGDHLIGLIRNRGPPTDSLDVSFPPFVDAKFITYSVNEGKSARCLFEPII